VLGLESAAPDDYDLCMRICSMLPSATEIICELGLAGRLVGRSHACDHPPEVQALPAVLEPLDAFQSRSPGAIDQAAAETLRQRGALYVALEDRLRELQPDLVIAQNPERVCAPAGGDLEEVLGRLPKPPTALRLDPGTFDEAIGSVWDVGEVTGAVQEAIDLLVDLHMRIAAVEGLVQGAPRPRVAVLEWLDPPYAAGHWLPDMVAKAGGEEVLGTSGEPSRRLRWEDITAARPEVLILAPSGLPTRRVLARAPLLFGMPGWRDLPAVRAGRVYCVDADTYLTRPGPRLAYGLELLAHVIHPDRRGWDGPEDAVRQVPC
jgi:iron complex transport system substrate-binding protein